MKEVSIEWKEKKSGISQVDSSGLEYAFVSEDWKQINQLVYCKDFLQDTLCAHYNEKKMSIYGYSYDPATCIPLYLKKTRLLISNWRDKTLESKIPGCLDFLNQIEKKLKFKRTIVYKVGNPEKQYTKSGAFILEGSKRWMIAPPMISMYSLLIRVGLSHTVGNTADQTIEDVCTGKLTPYRSDDRYQLKNAKIGMNWIFTHGDKKIFTSNPKKNFQDCEIGTMHEHCGIVGYSSEYPNNKFPDWYKLVKG